MAHDEDQGWNEEEITLSEIAELNARKKELKEGYRGYVARNRDIKDILNGFMTQALLEKPENMFEFARKASSKWQIHETLTAAAPNLRVLLVCSTSQVSKLNMLHRMLEPSCPLSSLGRLEWERKP